MKLIAQKSLRYAGRSLVAGDGFEASDRDARLLKAIGKAVDHVAEVVTYEDSGTSRDLHTGAYESQGRKGKYQTRRMKAADGAKDATEE